MATASAGIFTIDYTLRTRAEVGADLQFGMDFTLTQASTGLQLPLTQLIFPATSVGTNHAGVWNIDNHKPAGSDPACLIFAGAQNGVIADKPTELSKTGKGVLRTKFAVYRVDVSKAILQIHGVVFSYSINTSATHPATEFDGISTLDLPGDQKKLITGQCSTIKFS